MLKFLLNLFKAKKSKEKVQDPLVSGYTDFDYENLCEIYYHNEWIRKQTNYDGFENLWNDCSSESEKLVLKKLISKFTYVNQEEAKEKTRIVLLKCIEDWGLVPNNTLFIAFKIEEFADGSSIALNFIRPILDGINKEWKPENFIGDIIRGKRRIKDKDLKNIVLVDDFVGTGGTAKNRIKEVENDMLIKNRNLNIFVFSVGGMICGKRKIESCNVKYASTYLIDKGTNLAFPYHLRKTARNSILKMERMLHEGSDKVTLEKFSLGYEKSEALFSWNVFNLPNNNYPILWWYKYKDGSPRKSIFNRNQ